MKIIDKRSKKQSLTYADIVGKVFLTDYGDLLMFCAFPHGGCGEWVNLSKGTVASSRTTTATPLSRPFEGLYALIEHPTMVLEWETPAMRTTTSPTAAPRGVASGAMALLTGIIDAVRRMSLHTKRVTACGHEDLLGNGALFAEVGNEDTLEGWIVRCNAVHRWPGVRTNTHRRHGAPRMEPRRSELGTLRTPD